MLPWPRPIRKEGETSVRRTDGAVDLVLRLRAIRVVIRLRDDVSRADNESPISRQIRSRRPD